MTPAMKNLFQYGLPFMSGAFMLFWPACMQLSFFFTSIISLGQSYLLRLPAVRNWLGIQPLPKPTATTKRPDTPYTGTMNIYQAPSNAPPPPPAEKKGIIGGAISDIKSAASKAAEGARSFGEQKKSPTKRRTAAELRQAKAFEERRRREIEKEKVDIEFERRERNRLGR